MKEKTKLLSLLFVLLTSLVYSTYLYLPEHFQSLDNRVRDFYFNVRGPEPTTDLVTIIDIDERSLKELGQWPWERNKVAQILQNLTNNGAGIIGLDILFAETDKSSPSKFAKDWGLDPSTYPNYDLILSETIHMTPTILGYIFDFDTTDNQNEAPAIQALFIEKNKKFGDFLPQAKGVLKNIESIQDAGYSSGYINNIPDQSGIIRSVPLLIEYDDMLYPSLAFEMYRIALNTERITIPYSVAGIEDIKIDQQSIKNDRFGRIYLNFRGPSKSFEYISAVDVYNNNLQDYNITGKFILIGTSAYGLMDLRSTPMDNIIAGVEIHANLIDNLLKNDMLSKPSWAEGLDLFLIIFIIATVLFVFSRIPILLLIPTFILSVFLLMYFNYYLLFTMNFIINSLFPIASMIISLITILGVNYLFEFRQKVMIKGKFASKVSKHVMEDILKNADSNSLDGAEKEITVFFSDIRNFTNISEAMGDAKSLIKFMNLIMEPMTEIITKEDGTVDKYIGDAIMAYWNAPLDVKDHADKAVIASLNQLYELQSLNKKLRKNKEFSNVVKMSDQLKVPIVDIGIGLNSGMAVVGEMGSAKRSDYTAIGDSINLGARLESLCKHYNSKLNISNFTKEKLKGKYIFRFLDLVTVKGKSKPVEIWQVHDFDRESNKTLFYSSKKELLHELELYHKAIDHYKSAEFQKALDIFSDINSWPNKTNQNIYNIYIERCEHYIKTPPLDFNGVFEHTTKG